MNNALFWVGVAFFGSLALFLIGLALAKILDHRVDKEIAKEEERLQYRNPRLRPRNVRVRVRLASDKNGS